MSEKKNSIYKGKGYMLISANKDYIDNKKKKKNIVESRKTNIFNKFNPFIIPLLNKKENDNVKKEEIDEKIKMNDNEKILNLLNEDEINSFLLRNRAFRLAWNCIIEKIEEEIYLEMSKNIKCIFDDIYLYSISNSEYLPLILIAAGTNVSDHEIIIHILSTALKKMKYNKNDNFEYDLMKKKKKKKLINLNKHDESEIAFLNKLNKNYNTSDTNDNDLYICSLNSSTSNNMTSAIYSIYEQLNKEYKKRKERKKNQKLLMRNNKMRSGEIRTSQRLRNNKINDSNSNVDEKNKYANRYIDKDDTDDFNVNKKNISIDKLIELYQRISESEKEVNEKYNKYNSFNKNETSQYDNESFYRRYTTNEISTIDFNKLKSYNDKNNYFDDGRKKIRVIILIHDCEYFNINILNGILNLLINLRIDNKLCLSVILAVSTPSFFFNRITNPDTQSKLRIKTVDILNNKMICENICNSLIFENIIPFIINFRTIIAIKYLLNKNNQSITQLINILYILTKEFYDNNLFSFLCLPINYYLNIDENNFINKNKTKENIKNKNNYEYEENEKENKENYNNKKDNNEKEDNVKEDNDKEDNDKENYDNADYDNKKEHFNYEKESDNSDNNEYSSEEFYDKHEIETEYSPYTYVRSYQKSFQHYVKYDIRNLHKKIILLCYSANIYYIHLSYIKKKYSSILSKDYFNLHKSNSVIHTPTHSDNEGFNFSLKKTKKDNFPSNTNTTNMKSDIDASFNDINNPKKEYNSISKIESNINLNEKNEINPNEKKSPVKITKQKDDIKINTEEKLNNIYSNDISVISNEQTEREENNDDAETKDLEESNLPFMNKEKSFKKIESFNIDSYVWQFKANTINWWYEHPFKDLVYLYDIKTKNNVKTEINKLLQENNNINNNLYDIVNIKEINKNLCESLLPKCVLQLIERKYAFTIAINLINIILKQKPEYNNSTKRLEYFRKVFENYEKVKWNENTSILYIEELFKYVEADIKNCINFMIDIISSFFFKNEHVLLNILKDFKTYYKRLYPIVYNIETYIYLLKKKEKDKNVINDDFEKNCFNYSVTFSIYYTLLFKLDDLIEMLRTYIDEKRNTSILTSNSKNLHYFPSKSKNLINNEELGNEDDKENINNNIHETNDIKHIKRKKTFKRYLTIENTTKRKNEDENINIDDISYYINIFMHDYLYLLLLPPIFYHPLAYELCIHKPDKDFSSFMSVDIKTEILSTLSYTNPYKTGNLYCSCCFYDKPSNNNVNTNIVYNNKIYLNPNYDNISTLEDLINIYRIYEKCGKTIDLYNLFIYFLNIKIDPFLGYSIENEKTKKNILSNISNNNLYSYYLQEYYLRFVIAVSTLCYFFKILKTPNVSALLNYDDKDCTNNDINNDEFENSIYKYLSEIKKSLQGCTSKKLLFGKHYYNQNIISREFNLMKMLQETVESENENEDKDKDQIVESPNFKSNKKRKKN